MDYLSNFISSFGLRLGRTYCRCLTTACAQAGFFFELPQSSHHAPPPRPVSLFCSDYKLLSKVLDNRLSKVIDQVVHPDQTYCVPGRSIFDNIALIQDTFDVSKLYNIDIRLISIDQEKVFDRVEHA